MAFDGLNKAHGVPFVQRTDFFPNIAGRSTGVSGIRSYVVFLHCLLKRLVEHTMDVLDGFRGQSGFVLMGFASEL